MASLSDKLKSLGVKVGVQAPKEAPAPERFNIDEALNGCRINTSQGEVFVYDQIFGLDYRHGSASLNIPPDLTQMNRWAKVETSHDIQPEKLIFLDTETTGLAGGTGTYAFLIGLGKFVNNQFHLRQFFLDDPVNEPAFIESLGSFVPEEPAIVSYNGKSFDLPLLKTRYTTNRQKQLFSDNAHFDLLHLARRLWRNQLPDCSLSTVEDRILTAERTEEDIAGWMIPQMYFDYLKTGDARPLKRVFYHNAFDILSLTALFNHLALLLADPDRLSPDGEVCFNLAKLFADLGDDDRAIKLFNKSFDFELTEEMIHEGNKLLSFLYKQAGQYDQAMPLWEQATKTGQLYAFEELAKYYEHKVEDYQTAKAWTDQALLRLSHPIVTSKEKMEWLPELEHRLERLKRKTNQK